MKQLLLFLCSALLLAACSLFNNTKKAEPQAVAPKAASAAAGNAQTNYVDRYKDAAISEMQRTGIPASITLAQGIIESSAGQSELAVNANNHFGIKCGNNWTGKSVGKKDDDVGPDGQLMESCFRKYNNPDESFFDHSEFLRDPRKSNRYGFLFNLDKRDYKNWARGLQSSGYATSQTYANQLIDLIERLRLYEYDQPGGSSAVKPGGIIPASVPPQQRISQVNDVKVVTSREGETLADIARIYELRADKVADYNDRAYAPGQSIPTGTRVFIQSKRDSWHGQATHHFVRDKQTMLEISQIYGIKLDELRKRNGLVAGQEPAANEKVRLRGKRESGESIRLRSQADDQQDPTPATPTSPSPGSMTTDDSVVLDMGSGTGNKPTQPTGTPSMPGKPATTGVPYPPDPVPATPGNPGNPGTSPNSGQNTNPFGQPAPNYPDLPTTANPTPGGPYHTVVKGDTLYSISRKYGLTVVRLKQLNGMTNDNINIGQSLRIQ